MSHNGVVPRMAIRARANDETTRYPNRWSISVDRARELKNRWRIVSAFVAFEHRRGRTIDKAKLDRWCERLLP